MEIGQIEAFERVARDGSFTRAAQSLQLTQPAVSARIAQLEAEVGGALFERRGRRLYLSPLGQQFLPYAERMLAVMADGMQAMQHFRTGKQGQVRIAAPTPFVMGLLVDVLAEYRFQHPTIDILIRERNKTTIFDMLRDNTITLGLVNAPVFDRQLTHIARFRDPIRAVVAPSHPLALHTDKPMPMERLYEHTIFRVSMFPQMTAFMDEVVEQARAASGGGVIAVPMVMALRLVALGRGVTFLPESYVRHAVDEGQVRYLSITDMPPLMSEPVLIAQKDRQPDSIHTEFCRILQRVWRHLLV